VDFTYFDREERSATASGIDFSPPQPAGDSSSICWETTVVSIRNAATHMPTGLFSGVLGSRNTTTINVTPSFQNGWARMTFIGANANAASGVGLLAEATSDGAVFDSLALATTLFGPAPATFFGLPVTGFMVRTFSNGTLACSSGNCQGNYASLFEHAYTNNIAP